MKQIFPYLSLLMVLSSLLSSCEKMLEFDVGTIDSEVVVNSNAQVGKPLAVRVTYSRFFLDTHNFTVVEGATLTLNANGTDYPQADFLNGRYSFNYAPQEGDTLELRVQVAGHEDVVAGTRVPQGVQLDGIYTRMSPSEEEKAVIQFTLHDPGTEHNYYRLRIRSSDTSTYSYNGHTDTTINNYDNIFSCSDVRLLGQNDIYTVVDGGVETSALLFSDESFNGMAPTLSVQMSYWQISDGTSHYYIVVESLSYELYRYYCDVTASNDDIAFFNEPTRVFSNVTHGLGVFGATTTTEKELTMPTSSSSRK